MLSFNPGSYGNLTKPLVCSSRSPGSFRASNSCCSKSILLFSVVVVCPFWFMKSSMVLSVSLFDSLIWGSKKKRACGVYASVVASVTVVVSVLIGVVDGGRDVSSKSVVDSVGTTVVVVVVVSAVVVDSGTEVVLSEFGFSSSAGSLL